MNKPIPIQKSLILDSKALIDLPMTLLQQSKDFQKTYVEFFDYLRARVAFPDMQRLCKKHELPTATGWDKLKEKLNDCVAESSEKLMEVTDTLQKIFRAAIPLGTRAIRLYPVKSEHAKYLYDYLSTLESAPSSLYATRYPAPLSTTELAQVEPGLYLADIQSTDMVVTATFCTKRLYEDREPRSRHEIGSKAIEEFGWQEYDEFIFIKRRYIQTYDIVRVDLERSAVEIQVEEKSGVDTAAALNELVVHLNEIISNLGADFRLVNPLNLFDAIAHIYLDPHEGQVIELGFTTETGSAKRETMRTKGTDLRNETFHVGGRNAINGALTPFRVTVRWTDPETDAVEEATLPGSIRQLGSTTPYLDHVILKGMHSEAAKQVCLNRILTHLPKPNDDA